MCEGVLKERKNVSKEIPRTLKLPINTKSILTKKIINNQIMKLIQNKQIFKICGNRTLKSYKTSKFLPGLVFRPLAVLLKPKATIPNDLGTAIRLPWELI